MKKLMIAAAVVCVAAASHAAAFTWKTSAVAVGPTVADLGNLKNGQSYTPSSGSGADFLNDRMQKEATNQKIVWTYVMTLSANGFEDDTISGTVATYGSGKISQSTISGTGTGDMASDLMFNPASGTQDVSYKIVITGKYTDAKGTEWTLTSNDITGSQGFGEFSPLELTTAAPTSWLATSAAAPVPEPTSGLLLLLGVAGLALRRRRA